ncbi:MAG TPA: class I adenylate-forming enzyme family protein [Acidimicrobiales bacterium]|nr:class I adenylate-forming enzyme family protein [Acidimicrobiales bacterium]
MQLLIGDLLADAARASPERVAATLDDRSVTYRDLDRDANRIANALLGSGLRKGAVVAWISPPDLASLAGFAGSARTGAVFASVNPALPDTEIRGVLEYLQPHLVVTRDDLSDIAEGATDSPVTTIGSLLSCSAEAPPDLAGTLVDSDPHVIYLTSGTTGTPKGVEVSHRASWLRSFPGGSTFASGINGDGGILPSFPLFHYGGWHYVLEAWHHRCALHVCRRFDGDLMLRTAERWRPSAMYCIPAIWDRVLESLPPGSQALGSVTHADTGTSAAPESLLARLKEAMPEASRSVLYGSSEGGHHTTLFERQLSGHQGSVGRAAPPGIITISDEGEILYRSPTMMSGYYRLPDQTAAALRDGWYHTGDVGVMDEDGFLYITGRLREVIRTGGESVAPTEVEAALAGISDLADVAVVGVPDPSWGEVIAAAVVTAAGAETPDVATLRAHLDGTLASFKHPRLVVRVESIPRTAATRQVQRTLLRDEVLRLLRAS